MTGKANGLERWSAPGLDVLGDVVGCKPVVERGSKQAGDVRDTSASIDRARELIGYEPKVSLEDGLRAEHAWFVDSRSSE